MNNSDFELKKMKLESKMSAIRNNNDGRNKPEQVREYNRLHKELSKLTLSNRGITDKIITSTLKKIRNEN